MVGTIQKTLPRLGNGGGNPISSAYLFNENAS